MKSNFESNEQHRPVFDEGGANHIERASDAPLFAQPDAYFELISAYLDGEATVDERLQVQHLLDTDPQARKLYNQLLRLHHAIDRIPVPAATPLTVELSDKVFQSIDRQRRSNRLLFIGGAAIAALVVGAVSTIFSNHPTPISQIAQLPTTSVESEPEPLMVALNSPVVEIPDAAQGAKKYR